MGEGIGLYCRAGKCLEELTSAGISGGPKTAADSVWPIEEDTAVWSVGSFWVGRRAPYFVPRTFGGCPEPWAGA
jgi:hypothetical protein